MATLLRLALLAATGLVEALPVLAWAAHPVPPSTLTTAAPAPMLRLALLACQATAWGPCPCMGKEVAPVAPCLATAQAAAGMALGLPVPVAVILLVRVGACNSGALAASGKGLGVTAARLPTTTVPAPALAALDPADTAHQAQAQRPWDRLQVECQCRPAALWSWAVRWALQWQAVLVLWAWVVQGPSPAAPMAGLVPTSSTPLRAVLLDPLALAWAAGRMVPAQAASEGMEAGRALGEGATDMGTVGEAGAEAGTVVGAEVEGIGGKWGSESLSVHSGWCQCQALRSSCPPKGWSLPFGPPAALAARLEPLRPAESQPETAPTATGSSTGKLIDSEHPSP